jgi:hypothetical protein
MEEEPIWLDAAEVRLGWLSGNSAQGLYAAPDLNPLIWVVGDEDKWAIVLGEGGLQFHSWSLKTDPGINSAAFLGEVRLVLDGRSIEAGGNIFDPGDLLFSRDRILFVSSPDQPGLSRGRRISVGTIPPGDATPDLVCRRWALVQNRDGEDVEAYRREPAQRSVKI